MKSGHPRFAICTRNSGYEASLELRKLYRVIDDDTASQAGQVRVIDESGEDYLYPTSYFVPIELPDKVADQVEHAA